ncbi:MAG: radical SAM protein [Candidatus Daviesbacteria bacterium]|nr:radical SAM protein [Candidatus Daviesbacteria bacterium]
MFKEGIKDRAVGWLTRNPLVYSALASEPVHELLKAGISMYVRSLRDPQNPEILNPSNETLLKKLGTLEAINRFFLPEKERVFESNLANTLRKDLEKATIDGVEANSISKLKRTLGLMGERCLNKVLLDFMVVNFGLGTLKKHLLVQQGEPSFNYLTLQVNSDCNAKPRCPGCFAENNTSKLSDEVLDRVQGEAVSLASRFTIIIGGEPLLEKKSLLALFRKYNRTPFLIATNGILLDEDYAREVADLGNVITFINTPGLEDTTNKIRNNKSAWTQINKAAENLKKYHAASGFTATVYQNNFMEVSSGKFVQQMVDFDMMLGFYFAYAEPLGCSPNTELALTLEMSEEFSRRVQDVSNNYPINLIDTSEGRERILGGCPAGRRDLIYVQSDGNVGGCPMVPQSDGKLNVSKLSLREILRAAYFERIKKEQPSCLNSSQFWSAS